MRLIDRIMQASLKKPARLPGKRARLLGKSEHRIRPMVLPSSNSRDGRAYFSLEPDAMQIVRDLAKATNTSPAEVLRNSVRLYKLALEAQQAKVEPESAPIPAH